MRVFIAHGDRTDRNKARLKYVLDAMGFEKFLALVEEKLGAKLVRVPAEAVAAAPEGRIARLTSACMRRSRTGLNWIGVVLPVGKLTGDADARARRRSRRSWATAISGSPSGRTC